MKQYKKYLLSAALLGIMAGIASCKKDLDVKNPNQPTLADANTETGIVSLAEGAVYTNGFNGVSLSGLNWLGSSFFSLCYAYSDLMADDIAASTASNQNINVVNLPNSVTYDDGTTQTGSSDQRTILRSSNARSARASNPFYYEWGYMYSLNNACDNLLDAVEKVTFSGDADTKKNTIKAWAYWWKGYAYARIGSLYYSGIITNTTFQTNGHYLPHDSLILESNKNLDQAASILAGISNASDYGTILGQIIPDFTQVMHGGVPTTTEWTHNINTLKARNLLVNKRVKDMTSSDWTALTSLVNNGIQEGDIVFTAVTTSNNGFMSSSSGSAAAMSTTASSTFSISERLIQDFHSGDQRLAQNFPQRTTPVLNQTGGFTYSTRWYLANGGTGLSDVVIYSDKTPGNYELYIAGSYEENALMQAEALIYSGSVDAGLALIDAVRDYQGAGLAHMSGTGLTADDAKEELRRERRAALLFRGTAFYDARRWGVVDDVSKGGGRKGAVVLSTSGVLNTNATINYNFLDYWDVPADETELNPPTEGSAAIKNPN
ncbi:MAG TPA: RagB/SusD family nutrient uptake outer membrane protein [Puia sp.]|nr:RagB/SusD family nutrient uptake outer membrane protein [Puia sp.]